MLPNFLIIGVPRSGTTTIYEGLKQHPQIFVSPSKEPMFFILEGEKDSFSGPLHPRGPRDWSSYQSLFQGAKPQQAVGEASIYYLFSRKAPFRINEYLPEAKLIAILRNPVDRAYSHFLHNRLLGVEPLADFLEAMDAEEERIRKGWFLFWSYRGAGYYGQQIERYFSVFDREQFRFFLFDDLIADLGALFGDIFRFLFVDDKVQIRLPEKYNSSGVPRNRIVHSFLSKPNFVKNQLKRILSEKTQYNLLTKYMNRNLEKPILSVEFRRRIIEFYREDILKTQDLIRRDLSSWLLPEPTED